MVTEAVPREKSELNKERERSDGFAVPGPELVVHVPLVAALIRSALVAGWRGSRPFMASRPLRVEGVLWPVASLRLVQLTVLVLVRAVLASERPVRWVKPFASSRRVHDVLRMLVLIASDVVLHHPPHVLSPRFRPEASVALRGLVLWLHALFPFPVVCKIQQDPLAWVLRVLVPLVRLLPVLP